VFAVMFNVLSAAEIFTIFNRVVQLTKGNGKVVPVL